MSFGKTYRKKVLAAILLIAAGAGFAAVPGKVSERQVVRVKLPEAVFIVGPGITLGEVAEVTGADRALVSRLERLEIANAAPAGNVLKLSAASVRIAVKKAGVRGDVLVEGAEVTQVTTQSQEFDTAGLAGAVKNLVLSGTGESSENVEVTLGREPKRLRVPAGLLTTRVKPPLSGKYEGSQLYTIEIMVDGRLAKRQPLRAQVEIRRPVVVTQARLERGEKLNEKNVTLKRVPTSQAAGDVLTDLPTALGRTSGRMLEPGRVVRIGDLADPPMVRRNSAVRAVVKKNNIELAVDAKALDDGKSGQVIRIQNAASGRIFKARVLDEKTVEVVEPPKK